MAPTILFHIGLEKTGTSSFQRYCNENYRALRRRGVLYPVRGIILAGRSHGPLVASYLPYRDLCVGPHRASAAVLDSLREQIEAEKPDTVLISSEHFSSRFYDAQIMQLKQDFADYPCRIAMVVRDHVAHIRSAYAQTIMAGRTLSFDVFCDELLNQNNRYVRYRDTIAPWERAFGRENIDVFSCARGTDVVEMLCRALLPQAAEAWNAISYRDNKSLGASGTEALRQVNMALPRHEHCADLTGQFKFMLLRTARYRIRGLIVAAAGDREQGRYRISEYNRARLREIVDVDRQWLAARYGIHLNSLDADDDAPPDEALTETLAAEIKARPWVMVLMAMRRMGYIRVNPTGHKSSAPVIKAPES